MTRTIRPLTRRQVTRTAVHTCGCATTVTSDLEHVAAELDRIRASRCPFHYAAWRRHAEELIRLRRPAGPRLRAA